MVTINLKKYYPDNYTEDTYIEVTEEVAAFMEDERRRNENYRRKTYRHHAQYSLDARDGIEEETILLAYREAAEHEELCAKLEQSMQSLTQAQYRRMKMRFEQGMKYAEIAKAEGVTIKAAEKSVRNGLVKLKKILVNIS